MDIDPGYVKDWAAAAHLLDWVAPPLATVSSGLAGVSWFEQGRLDATWNLLQRHVADPESAQRIALNWEGEGGDVQQFTYTDLDRAVGRFAIALVEIGVVRGDEVVLFLGALPETAIAMLACARLGATHVALSPSLPADALAERLAKSPAGLLITQDGAWRHGVVVPLKARADEATAATSSIEHTIVVRRCGIDVDWYEGDYWYHDIANHGLSVSDPRVVVDGDDRLLGSYLTRQRGEPSAYYHSAVPLLVYAAASHRRLSPFGTSTTWCTYDVGNVAQQVHGLYGPLLNGDTAVLYEGMLDTPATNRTWDLLRRYDVTTFVTTPSVVRHLRAWGEAELAPPSQHLRHVVLIGEPTAATELEWLCTRFGDGVVISDGWGQTELGGIVTLTPLRGSFPTSSFPQPRVDVVDSNGASCPPGQNGELVIKDPWPAIFSKRDRSTAVPHLSQYPGLFATGDEALIEADGNLLLVRPLDRFVKVSGQLVSPHEVLDIVCEHPSVYSAEVVDYAHARRGRAVAVIVQLVDGVEGSNQLGEEIRDHVSGTLGGLARPHIVAFVDELPAVPNEAFEKASERMWTGDRPLTIILREREGDPETTLMNSPGSLD